jgi:hypothetical protein
LNEAMAYVVSLDKFRFCGFRVILIVSHDILWIQSNSDCFT